MVEFDLFRESFFGFSLHTGCLIFAYTETVLLITLCLFVFFYHSAMMMVILLLFGEALVIPLFYGVYKEQHYVLHIFASISMVLAAGIALCLSATLFTLMILALEWLRDGHDFAVNLLLSMAVGLAMALLVVSASYLVARNHAMELKKRKMDNEPEAEATTAANV